MAVDSNNRHRQQLECQSIQARSDERTSDTQAADSKVGTWQDAEGVSDSDHSGASDAQSAPAAANSSASLKPAHSRGN